MFNVQRSTPHGRHVGTIRPSFTLTAPPVYTTEVPFKYHWHVEHTHGPHRVCRKARGSPNPIHLHTCGRFFNHVGLTIICQWSNVDLRTMHAASSRGHQDTASTPVNEPRVMKRQRHDAHLHSTYRYTHTTHSQQRSLCQNPRRTFPDDHRRVRATRGRRSRLPELSAFQVSSEIQDRLVRRKDLQKPAFGGRGRGGVRPCKTLAPTSM
ncbi:hypothetical protein OF83DRAFT_924371 [Amylostereum chailletii]|nr:hypothetical protein OF83DRAFT_924371 [Amylostereum chailletii]